MKYLTLLLILATSVVQAQEYSIYLLDGTFYLRTTETVENGTGIDDTIRTVSFLGDSSAMIDAVRNLDISNANEYVRLLKRVQDTDQFERDQNLGNAALSVGIDLDSINDARYADQLMLDTIRMVVYLNRLSDSERLIWTTDPLAPNRLVVAAYVERRPNGNIRLYTDPINENIRIRMDGPRLLQINNLPGVDALYKDSENDNVAIWRDAGVGRPKVRLFVQKRERSTANFPSKN